jgi:hypothetical protein
MIADLEGTNMQQQKTIAKLKEELRHLATFVQTRALLPCVTNFSR